MSVIFEVSKLSIAPPLVPILPLRYEIPVLPTAPVVVNKTKSAALPDSVPVQNLQTENTERPEGLVLV
jgi:hypothetical protein